MEFVLLLIGLIVLYFVFSKGSTVAGVGAGEDAWEGAFWEAADPKRFSARLAITYRDANGSVTERQVRVREFDNEVYGGMMIGHCSLRDATRTFRFDRVQTAIDAETGAVISDLRFFLNTAYENSAERSVALLAEDYLDVMKVLFYVAKADGQFRKEERVVVCEYAKKLTRDDRISIELVEPIFKEFGLLSAQAFKLAVGRVFSSGGIDPVALAECCREIVATQKTVHHAEKDALEFIDKKLAAFQRA